MATNALNQIKTFFNQSSQKGSNFFQNVKLSFSSTDEFYNRIFWPYVFPIILFMLLVPGTFLNLPPSNLYSCQSIVPLTSTQKTGDGDGPYSCWQGELVVTSTKVAASFGGGTGYASSADTNTICKAQSRCGAYVFSRTSSWTSAFVHAIVFLIVFNVTIYLVKRNITLNLY